MVPRDMNQATQEKLMKLNDRLTKESRIDARIKKHIKQALSAYSHANIKNQDKTLQEEISILLHATVEKLENLSEDDNDLESIIISGKRTGKLKKYVLGLEKVAKTQPEQLSEVMTKAITYAIYLEKLNKLKKKNRIRLSKQLLTLFLLLPSTKAEQKLQSSNGSNCDMVESGANDIKQNSIPIVENFEEKLSGGNPDKIFDEISAKIIEEYEAVTNFTLPVSEESIKTVKEKLSDLEIGLDKNKTIQNKKKQLSDKIFESLESLKHINHDANTLIAAERKMFKIAEINENFVKKKNNYDLLLQSIRNIHTINKELNAKLANVLNRISGYILVEGMNYLRHKLIVIEDYKTYAQEFAYTKRISMYHVKKTEIESLAILDCSTEESNLFQERVTIIQYKIEEVLTLLEKKADSNERTILKLNELNQIVEEIPDNIEPSVAKLQLFNEYRNKIQEIEDFSFRICEKRAEVLQQLHHSEMEMYNKLFPDIALTVEKHLRNYEFLTHQLNSLQKSEKHLTNEEITKERTDMKELIQEKIPQENIEDLQQIFTKFFDHMEQLLLRRHELDKLVAEVDSISNNIDEFSNSNIPDTESINTLNGLEEKVNSLDKDSTRNDLLKHVLHLQVRIEIEKAKIEIDSTINSRVKELAASIKSLKFFEGSSQSTIEDVLTLKERIEDFPKGNSHLESRKKSVLRELYSVLSKVDQPLAHFAFKKRKFDNVLNLENYFGKFEFDGVPDKENVDFVRKVRSHAKTFENRVKSYLGSRNSTDYYIIDENLSRCLDELNELECDNDTLLDETVKAMTDIKQLKSELLNNAYCSD